jgi:hypothetical protein
MSLSLLSLRIKQYVTTSCSLLLVVGCGIEVSPDLQQQELAAAAATVAFELKSPQGIPLSDVVIVGEQSLVIDDRVEAAKSASAGEMKAFASFGAGKLEVGAGAIIHGSLYNGGDVTLRSGATVTGEVVAGGKVQQQSDARVGGKVFEGPAFRPETLHWDVSFPHGTQDVRPQPEAEIALAPASYGQLSLSPRSKLKLHSGTYFFKSFNVEPEALIEIDTDSGPVIVYIASSFSFRGTIATSGSEDNANVLFAYAGSSSVEIEGRFRGTIVAPDATINLRRPTHGQHHGAWFAKVVHVFAHQILRHCAFDFSVVGRATDGEDEEAVILRATKIYKPQKYEDGEQTFKKHPILFKLPEELPVAIGNAGNGTATLTIGAPGGTNFVCTYAGGSSTEHPTDLLDAARGLAYKFKRCKAVQGKHLVPLHWRPGQPVATLKLKLRVNQGDADHFAGRTSIEIGLPGTGCGSVREPMSAEETAIARAKFSWADTMAVPEDDGNGQPSLWYGRVYVKESDEYTALDEMLIHHNPLPMWLPLDTYRNACGDLRMKGDGKGAFEYIVIPGVVYNKIRELALSPVPSDAEEDQVLYQAMELLPASDPRAVNANGSLSYKYLQEIGFRYRDQEEPYPDDAEDEDVIEQPLWGKIKKAAKKVINKVAKPVVNGAIKVVTAVDRFALGSANVSVRVSIRNIDPEFPPGSIMQRGWGADAGKNIALEGAEITAVYPSPSTLLIPGAPAAITHTFKIGADGVARMKLPKRLPLIAMYLKKENKAARIYTGPITDRRFTRTFYNDLSFLSQDKSLNWNTSERDLHAMAQFTDGYEYIKEATGKAPHQAEVLAGPVAGLMSISNGGRPWAPCFGFENLTKDAILGLATTIVPSFLHPVLEFLTSADIILSPSEDGAIQSRVFPSHEYGHFALCTMAYQRGFFGNIEALLALSKITLAYAFGGVESAANEASVLYEAYADFFAGQVAGGVNRFTSAPRVRRSGLINLCHGGACLEANRMDNHPLNFNARIAWATTLFHDAFDGQDNLKPLPTDGDLWWAPIPPPPPPGGAPSSPPLVLTTARYSDSCGKTGSSSGRHNVTVHGPFFSADGRKGIDSQIGS